MSTSHEIVVRKDSDPPHIADFSLGFPLSRSIGMVEESQGLERELSEEAFHGEKQG